MGVVLDAHGKIGWGRFGHRWRSDRLSSCPRQFRMRTWRGCAARAVSYIFAGKSGARSRPSTGHPQSRTRALKRLLLEGGGGANGAFLRAWIDRRAQFDPVSGRWTARKGAPSVFDSTDAEVDRRAPITAMTLESSQGFGRRHNVAAVTGSRTRIFGRANRSVMLEHGPDHIQNHIVVIGAGRRQA